MTIGSLLGKIGAGLGWAGVGLALVQVQTGEKTKARAGVDIGMGLIGMYYPGPGTVASGAYFLLTLDYRYEYSDKDPRLVPADHTYVVPTYKSLSTKGGN